MRKDINKAIRGKVSSVDTFNKRPKKEEVELDLIARNIDIKKFGAYADELKQLLDPYSDYRKDQLRKVYAIFVGFDWSYVNSTDLKTIRSGMGDHLETCLMENKGKIYKRCKKAIDASDIDNSIEFFFLPFKDIQEIKKYFAEEVLS